MVDNPNEFRIHIEGSSKEELTSEENVQKVAMWLANLLDSSDDEAPIGTAELGETVSE